MTDVTNSDLMTAFDRLEKRFERLEKAVYDEKEENRLLKIERGIFDDKNRNRLEEIGDLLRSSRMLAKGLAWFAAIAVSVTSIIAYLKGKV